MTMLSDTAPAARAGSGELRRGATVDGGRLRDFVSYQDMPCTGLFTGQAVMKDDGKRIVGRYTGQSCRGPAEAYFVGDRE